QVDLVEDQECLSFGSFHQLQHKLVAGAEFLRDVDNQQQDIAADQCVLDFLHHPFIQGVGWLVNAGGIDKDDLPGLPVSLLLDVDDSGDAVSRGLRLVSYDGQLFADKCIEQGGLPCIRATDDGNETGAKRHTTSLPRF